VEEKMSPADFPEEFSELDAISVFKKVGIQLPSEKSRSLWQRMQSEMQSGSVRHVMSYLESVLKQKSEQVREDLNRLKEEVEQ